jgi:hypothetical protein
MFSAAVFATGYAAGYSLIASAELIALTVFLSKASNSNWAGNKES